MKEKDCGVYISIADGPERILTLLMMHEKGIKIYDAADTPESEMHYIFCKNPFAYLLDSEACKRHEKFWKDWYEETDDSTPLLFWGDWKPDFFHRSIHDITGITSDQLEEILMKIKEYRLAETEDQRPIILFPSRDYLFEKYSS